MTNGIFVIVSLLSFFATLIYGQLLRKLLIRWVLSASSTGFHCQSLVPPSHLLLGSFPSAKPAVPYDRGYITSLLGMALAGRIYKGVSMYKGNIPNAAGIRYDFLKVSHK